MYNRRFGKEKRSKEWKAMGFLRLFYTSCMDVAIRNGLLKKFSLERFLTFGL